MVFVVEKIEKYKYTLNNDTIKKCIDLNSYSQFYEPRNFTDNIQQKYNMKKTTTPTINELLL